MPNKSKFPNLHGFAPGVWIVTGETPDSIQLCQGTDYSGDPEDVNELVLITRHGFVLRMKASAVDAADFDRACIIPSQFGPEWHLPDPVEAVSIAMHFPEICDTLRHLGKPCFPLCIWTNMLWPCDRSQAIYAELRSCLLDVDVLFEDYGVVVIKHENY